MYSNKTTLNSPPSDDDVYYYICWRLKLEGETENMMMMRKVGFIEIPRCDIDGVGEGR